MFQGADPRTPCSLWSVFVFLAAMRYALVGERWEKWDHSKSDAYVSGESDQNSTFLITKAANRYGDEAD